MDRTTLTLAVDSTQVGTAAAAFDRFVNAGNSAATSASRVTSAALAQGRSIAQTLVPALNTGIARTRTLEETQRVIGADASRQISQQVTAARAVTPAVQPVVRSASTGAVAPTAVPNVAVTGAAGIGQLTTAATGARSAIDRLTASARAQRSALAELEPTAAEVANLYRRMAVGPVNFTRQGAQVVPAAGRSNPAAGAPTPTPQPAQSSNPASGRAAPAPNQGAAGAFTAAAAAANRGATATNAFTAAQGRAAEAAQHLAEANARNEAANARLAAAIQRATIAQVAFDNASRSGGNAEAAVAAQTRLQSAQAAVSTATANVARTQRGATEAAERHRAALAATGRQSALTANQTQQLHFQLHDFFVQVASGQSPLTAFVQQGSQLSGTFGGAGGAFRAITSLLTPMRLALGGVAGAVAALGYAFYEGSKQSKAFADAIVLSGNYAGQTEGKFNALTREVAARSTATVGAAREAAQALIATGEVGPQVFSAATEAVTRYAEATGQTAADVVKDFASMGRAPSKWAEEHNRSLNFITAAQYELIKTFEESGRSADAQGIIYNALNDRLRKLEPNLGGLDRALINGKKAWSEWWDAAFGGTGRADTVENRIAALQAKINAASTGRNPLAREEHGFKAPVSGEDAAGLQYQLQDELAGQARQQADSINDANKGEAAKAGIAAKTVIDSYLKRGKAASAYKDALDKLNRSFKDAEAAGTPISGADKKVALTELKKEFTPAKNGEAAQVLRAQLQNDLKGIQDVLQAERDALNFQQNYLQSVYQRGGVSLTDYYEQKRKAIAEGVAAELDELDKEKARLQQYLGQAKDPSEKVQTRTRINEIDAEKSKLELRASRDTVLTNEEESSSYKALSEQVINYRANLLQMQGDEAGAAALRAQTVIANAKVLASQATALPGAPKIDVEELTRAITLTDQFNEVQRQTSLLASTSTRAEEAYLLVAEQSGKSLMETERGLYALRSTELAQLGALAAKAKELADASTDPKIKAFAADLALEYAKAANAIDPALNRLRDANRELAAGLAQSVSSAPNAFVEFYNQRRSQSEQDIKTQKDEYDKRIDQLRGYLSQEKDERNKATLQKRINQLQGESDGLKVESKGKTAIDAIKKTVLEPAAQQVSSAISKVLIQDPLQKYIEGQLKGLTEGDGLLAGFFKKALGVEADPKQQALLQQTAALNASSSALDTLKSAAENAANALNKPLSGARTQEGRATASGGDAQSSVAQTGGDPTQPPSIDSDLAGVQSDVTESLIVFDKQTTTTASDVLKLASAAGAGGEAMVRLPGIVGLFQSAVMAMQGSSGSSGSGSIGSFITSLFGGSGEAASYEAAAAATGIFHSGGIVGQPPATRNVSMGLFASAPRYHTGGIVGKAADKVGEALKHNEVPAILMGGPKGKREEVLRADDPRHRDNLGMSVVARILDAAKFSMLPGVGVSTAFAGGEKSPGSHSSASSLFQFASGAKGQMESSASVLGSLFDRFEVGQGNRPEPLSGIRPRGARELGGPVSAGGMYRVNEKGPELLEVAGKQYLMMGGQGGKVEANSSQGEGRVINQTINFHSNGPVTRQTQQQLAAAAYRGSARASSRND
jgi:hypothetical protein